MNRLLYKLRNIIVDNEVLVSMVITAAVLLAILTLVLIPPVSAQEFVVARGDPFTYIGNSTPGEFPNSTGLVWVFGVTDSIYGKKFDSYSGNYRIFLSMPEIYALEPGTYDFYIQFPGQNHVLDLDYNTKNEIGTIYKNVANISLDGLSPRLASTKLDDIMQNPMVDDVFIKDRLIVQEPDVKIVNMYTTGKGALHLDASTNLALNDRIFAIIDEETYQSPEYIKMMSNNVSVTGAGNNRGFSLEFPQSIAPQLNAGTHFISVHYMGNKVVNIPFQRYTDFIAPTPTPEINYYYSVNGELLGYWVNTTRPNETPAPTPTPATTYTTVLAENRTYSNRTIQQHGDIYVGEQNLNVFGTLGWMNQDGTYKLQFCEWGDNVSVVTIKNPYHFYVDPALFRNYLGAWCQYDSSSYEYRPPVAFIVKWTANLGGTMVYDSVGKIVNQTPTPTPTPTRIPATVTTIPTPTPTPSPVPTTESITVPVPWWIAVVAIVGAFLWKRKP